MSKKEKLKDRFKTKPKDFKYSELYTLLTSLGYTESNKGASSGSATSFINLSNESVILLHKPHNPDTLRQYQIKEIISELENHNLI